MATQPAQSNKVVTGKVRLSFAHIFEPYSARPEQEPKYSTMILIPKTDTATLNKIKAAQKVALENGKHSKFGGKIPKNWANTLRDGDEEYDIEENPEMEGMMFMNINSKTAPGVVGRDRKAITDPSEIYSGCYVRVSMNAFPYSASGNKGVSFGLENLQKWEDGEMLGGSSSKAEDDFDELDDELDNDEDDLL